MMVVNNEDMLKVSLKINYRSDRCRLTISLCFVVCLAHGQSVCIGNIPGGGPREVQHPRSADCQRTRCVRPRLGRVQEPYPPVCCPEQTPRKG